MRRLYFTIFLVSCSSLMFEVSLTRLFSISLWYHFAFMVISIAMLGIGFAGTILALFPGRSESAIRVCPALAGISILLCFIISHYIPFDPVTFSWDKAQVLYIVLYCVVLSIPFFFTGMLIASAFSLHSERSGVIYGSDLIGAGSGSLLVIVFLNIAPPEYAVFSASLLCLTGALISSRGKIMGISLFFLIINLLLFVIHPDFTKVKMSPYKSLSLYMKFPGAEHFRTYFSSHSQIDLFKSPAVRFAPGLSLLYTGELPEQVGIAIDGNSIDVITDARDRSQLRFLEYLPSSAAYETGNKNDVLVLDPGGGLHVMMADYYGSERVHKIESHPLVIDVIRKDYDEFSGRIYNDHTWIGFGRSILKSNRENLYDVIDLSMTGTSVSRTFGISEDYRFTVEAFMQYLKSLKQGGIMSVSLYIIPPPRTEFRILSTIVTALQRTGINDAMLRLAMLRSWDSMTLLVKNTPFTEYEIERIKEFSVRGRFDLLYYPGIQEGESNRYIKTSSDEYVAGIRNILNPETRSSFVDNYLFDIKPVYDENPFFHYYLKLNNIKAIYESMGQKLLFFMEEGYLLPVLFLTVLVFSSIIISIPVLFRILLYKRVKQFKQIEQFSRLIPVIIYFSMLGLGFMFFEVTLIHKSILLLENPVYSVATIVTSILIGSGVGSFSGYRSPGISTPFSILILSLLIVTFSLIYPLFTNLLIDFDLPFRIIALFIAMLPLGFFMGIPFPAGIRFIGEKHRSMIPWAWAINACLSVIAPVLTIMIALVAGFQSVLWISATAYFIAFATFRTMLKKA